MDEARMAEWSRIDAMNLAGRRRERARIAAGSRYVGMRMPIKPGWHAEQHGPFEQFGVYLENSDGTRQWQGSLTTEALVAWIGPLPIDLHGHAED